MKSRLTNALPFGLIFAKVVLSIERDLASDGDGAMSISGISSSTTNPNQPAGSQTNFRQSLNQLFSAVSSGNLPDAQQAYSTLSELQSSGEGPSPTSNTPLAQTLNQIGQSLQNGNLSGAQQALASLQQTQQAHGGHHHHGHHGGGVKPAGTSTTSSSTDTGISSSSGGSLDITA